MPEKLEDCVSKVKGQKGVDDAWAICTDSIEETIMKQVIETKLKGCGCQKKTIS